MLNTLHVAQSGLQASKTQVENVMNNIANENTPGYKKRVVNTSEVGHVPSQPTGLGVSVDGVARITDDYMYDKLVTEAGKLNDMKTLNSLLNSIEAIFHETDDAGLSADLNRYFKSLENLKTSPNNTIYKNDLKNNGNILVKNMQEIYKNIEELEESTKKEAELGVKEVNNILKDIGAISKKIEETPGPNNDLLDKRDKLEKDLAKYIDVEISREDPYQLKIAGITAIRFGTDVNEIQFIEKYTPQQDAYIKVDSDGNTKTPYESNLIDSTWGENIPATSTQEVKKIPISGASTGQIEFLGRTVPNTTAVPQTALQVINDIVTDSGNIIATWNSANPGQEIAPGGIVAVDLDADGTNDAIQITYLNTEGNVDDIKGKTQSGIVIGDSIEVTRGGNTSTISEEQTLQLTGTTTNQAYFLGTAIAGSPVAGGETAAQTATRIAADGNIITNWNNDPANADKQIKSITADTSGKLTITYKSHMADVPIMEETSSRGISYAKSEETVKGAPEDSITYTLNNEYQITVTHGETIYEADGVTPADINNDGVADENDIVDKDNAIQALVYRINQDNYIGASVKAYNGKYEVDKDGNKIEMNNPLHSQFTSKTDDHYLYIEATTDGEKGSFVGEVTVNDNSNKDPLTNNYIAKNVSTNNSLSKEGIDDIHLELYEDEIEIKGGMLKPMIDNLKTDSGKNSFSEYKQMLDNFAKKLSDYSSSFIETSDGKYTYGEDASQISGSGKKVTEIGLFKGADVKSLEFQDNSVNNLSQEKLDYLASIQWKKDIDFEGEGTDTASFSQYFQTLRVKIADTRENVIFNQEAQTAVTESIQNTYDKLTKVDKDAEMIELIKYQSGYEANAKLITIVDEMLQTLLGMKR